MTQSCTWTARLSSSLNARLHWRARAKIAKAEREQAALMCRTELRRPNFPCTVILTRVGPRQLDDDNEMERTRGRKAGCPRLHVDLLTALRALDKLESLP